MSLDEMLEIQSCYSEFIALSSIGSDTEGAQKTSLCSLIDPLINCLCEDLKKSHCAEKVRKKCVLKIQKLEGLSGSQCFRRVTSIETLFARHSLYVSSTSMKAEKEIKRLLKSESEVEIGHGTVVLANHQDSFVPCIIKKRISFSQNIGKVITVFNAYIPGENERVGMCKFRFAYFDAYRQAGQPGCQSAGVMRIDSFAREKYQGIGTLLIRAVMEYGKMHRTAGRIVLNSLPETVGFYYKLGMRALDDQLNRKIEQELENAKRAGRDPVDVTDGDLPLMYMPDDSVCKWEDLMKRDPILHPQELAVASVFPAVRT